MKYRDEYLLALKKCDKKEDIIRLLDLSKIDGYVDTRYDKEILSTLIDELGEEVKIRFDLINFKLNLVKETYWDNMTNQQFAFLKEVLLKYFPYDVVSNIRLAQDSFEEDKWFTDKCI